MRPNDHWKPASTALRSEEYANAVAEHPVVVIHAWAVWDSYDRQMDALLADLRPDYADKIMFYSYNTDQPGARDILLPVNVINIPTLICYVRGQWNETLIGLRPKDELSAKLQALCLTAEQGG